MALPPLRAPDDSEGPFPERTTRKLTATVKDESDTAIPGASLTTLTWTLYDELTQAIINSRDDVDIKANVSALGVLTLTLAPADMAILDSTLAEERHRILFEWTFDAGAKGGKHEVRISVSNLAKVS